nr:ERI1 exoribonuclease 3 isoform X4 [Pelodiscus sinensis]|eukprot:XP_014424853.1 ERI1 exoribonuclease 3 isoform X4 [Pelodiscus sinensis]
MLVTQASLFQVSDASGLSMVALFHTGAAKIPPSLLLRVRPALCSHRPRCFLQGCGSIVRRKLASHGFGASMAAMSSFPPQRYHYFLVLDFEATCDKPQIHPQEIIEFPILKLNGRTMEIESTFHMYVQPMVHPQLTPFCTELTGIIQGMVDGQPSLQQVLERVDEWMAKEGLLDPSVKSIFVTCGDWDLKVMLPGQCQYLGLPVADYFKQWINLKKLWLQRGVFCLKFRREGKSIVRRGDFLFTCSLSPAPQRREICCDKSSMNKMGT